MIPCLLMTSSPTLPICANLLIRSAVYHGLMAKTVDYRAFEAAVIAD